MTFVVFSRNDEGNGEAGVVCFYCSISMSKALKKT